MKKVILKFVGTGFKNNLQAKVFIYDKNKNIVFEGKTYNGYLILCLNNNSVYKLVALSYGQIIRNVFYVNNNYEKYVFYFKRSLRSEASTRTITFLLKDANYNNLPVEKGEIILWQK